MVTLVATIWIAQWSQHKRFDDLNGRFDGLKADINRRFEEVNRRFDEVNRRLDEVIKRLVRIGAKFDNHEQRIVRLEERTSPVRVS